MTGDKFALIYMLEEQIDNIISLGDPNPTPHVLAHIITDQPGEYDGFTCSYDEAFKMASALIIRRTGIKLIDACDMGDVALLLVKDLIDIADSIIEVIK